MLFCLRCGLHMSVFKTGALVVEYAFEDPPVPYRITSMDVMKCRNCGALSSDGGGRPILHMDTRFTTIIQAHRKADPLAVYEVFEPKHVPLYWVVQKEVPSGWSSLSVARGASKIEVVLLMDVIQSGSAEVYRVIPIFKEGTYES